MADSDNAEQKQDAPPVETAAASDAADLPPQPPQPPEPQNSKPDGVNDSALKGDMDFLLDIPLEISVELGRTKMLINELLHLGQGSVIELSKLAGETLEIFANQKLVARGEVVVINEKYGIRLTEIISPSERIKRLK